MLHRTCLFRSCSLCIAGQTIELSATCSAKTKPGQFQPRPLHSLVLWSSKNILWGQLPKWHTLYMLKSATRFRDVKVTTDNLVIVTRPFSLWGKSLRLQIPHYHHATETGTAVLYTGFQIPVPQGGMGWRKGNKHEHFVQCSLLKPFTVVERLVNSIWAQSPP